MLRIFANNLASATCFDLFCFAGLLHMLSLGLEVVSLFPTASGFDQQALTVTTFDSIDAVSCKCGPITVADTHVRRICICQGLINGPGYEHRDLCKPLQRRLQGSRLLYSVQCCTVYLLNSLTNWQHAGRSMGPSHQAYLAQATESQ